MSHPAENSYGKDLWTELRLGHVKASEKWPEAEAVMFATPADAKFMAGVLNDIYSRLEHPEWASGIDKCVVFFDDELTKLRRENKKLRGELDGMWEHIRNLESSFLSPQDHQKAVNKIANDRHDQVVSAMAGGPAVKPNCF